MLTFINNMLHEPGIAVAVLLFVLICILVWRVPAIINANTEVDRLRIKALRDELDYARHEIKYLKEKVEILQTVGIKNEFLYDLRARNKMQIEMVTQELERTIGKLKNFDMKNPDLSDTRREEVKQQLMQERDRLVREVKVAYVERGRLLQDAEDNIRQERYAMRKIGKPEKPTPAPTPTRSN